MGKKNIAYVNHEMLKWARSETPFKTPYDAETYIAGIKGASIEAWENGDDYPSITEAKKLASAYHVPFACFFLSAPPDKKIKRYTDRRTMSGTIYGEASYELWSEIDRVIGNREKLMELTDDSWWMELPVCSENATVDEIANAIRHFLGITLPFKNKSVYKNAFNYYRSIFEHHGIIVAQVSGVSLHEMKGLSIYHDKCSIIAVNNKDYERAKVFSLFHEMAHLIRRSSSLCLIDFDERNDEEEKICDKIAAAVLLPESAVRSVTKSIKAKHSEWSSLCLQSIGDKFGVSSVTVLRRLHELGVILNKEYYAIYDCLNEEFEANREIIEATKGSKSIPISYHIRYLNQQGYLYPRAVVDAHARGEISFGEMCRTLNVNSKHIGKIEQAVMFT